MPEKKVEITPIEEVLYEEKKGSPYMCNTTMPTGEENNEIVEESNDESSTDGESESTNEATSPPQDVISIYSPNPNEIIVDLCSYAYDLVLK